MDGWWKCRRHAYEVRPPSLYRYKPAGVFSSFLYSTFSRADVKS